MNDFIANDDISTRIGDFVRRRYVRTRGDVWTRRSDLP